MNNKITLIVILANIMLVFSSMFGINLKNYTDQGIEGRNKLVEAIQGLKEGKAEIANIHYGMLKPQLIDVLHDKILFLTGDGKTSNIILQPNTSPEDPINKPEGQITILKDAIDSISGMPKVLTYTIAIGDLKETLEWLRDKPLTEIENHLESTRNNFDAVAQELDNPAIGIKFDLAITKLQSAVCKIEKTLKAMKATFTPSPECAKPK